MLKVLIFTEHKMQQMLDAVLETSKKNFDALTAQNMLYFQTQQELAVSNDEMLEKALNTVTQTYNSFLLDLQRKVEQNSGALGTNIAICTSARTVTVVNDNVRFTRNHWMYSVRISGLDTSEEVMSHSRGTFTVPQGAGGLYRLQFSLNQATAVTYALITVRNETNTEAVKEQFEINESASKVIYHFLKEGDFIYIEKVSSQEKKALFFCIDLVHPYLDKNSSKVDLPQVVIPRIDKRETILAWPHWENPDPLKYVPKPNFNLVSTTVSAPRSRNFDLPPRVDSTENAPQMENCAVQISSLERELGKLKNLMTRKFKETEETIDEKDKVMKEIIRQKLVAKGEKGERGERGHQGEKGERGYPGQRGDLRGETGRDGRHSWDQAST